MKRFFQTLLLCSIVGMLFSVPVSAQSSDSDQKVPEVIEEPRLVVFEAFFDNY